MRRFALILALALAPQLVAAQEPTEPSASLEPGESAELSESSESTEGCTIKKFRIEVLYDDRAAHSDCPRPHDPQLTALAGRVAASEVRDTQAFFEVLRQLRAYLRIRENVPFHARLAEHIDDVLERAKQRRSVTAAFGEVRAPLRDSDPLECLFVTGDAGQPGYACYVLADGARPLLREGRAGNAGSAGSAPPIVVLADFAQAYRAVTALSLARAALLKLDVPELDRVIARLKLAERRWHNLRSRGYLQYPWELLISSAFSAYDDYQACFATDAYCSGEEGLDPESLRLIALHPGVGAGFQGFGYNGRPSPDAALSFSVEAIGFTAYAEDFDWYAGLSLGALVNDGDFGDIRPAVFAHLTRWVHVGYGLSLMRSASRADGTLFVSMDLGTAFGASFLD